MIPEFRRLKPQLQIPLLAERVDLCRKFLDILVRAVAVLLDDPHQALACSHKKSKDGLILLLSRCLLLDWNTDGLFEPRTRGKVKLLSRERCVRHKIVVRAQEVRELRA